MFWAALVAQVPDVVTLPLLWRIDWGPLVAGVASGIGGAAAALAGWLSLRRRTSGSVESSDARTLWAELRANHKEMRAEVESLRTERARQAAEIARLNLRVAVLEGQIIVLRARLGETPP